MCNNIPFSRQKLTVHPAIIDAIVAIFVILSTYLWNRCCHWLDIQTVEFMSNLHNFDRQPIYAIGRFSSFFVPDTLGAMNSLEKLQEM